MIPNSYREVKNPCYSCKHVFVKYEHEEGPWYYCHIDKSERPLCGSVAMHEKHFPDDDEAFKKFDIGVEDIKAGNEKYQAYDKWYFGEYRKISGAWDKWAETHSVSGEGTCDEFESR